MTREGYGLERKKGFHVSNSAWPYRHVTSREEGQRASRVAVSNATVLRKDVTRLKTRKF